MRAMNKKQNFLATVALCLLICGKGNAAAPLPEQFQSIKDFVLESVSESQRIGASTAYQLLDDNLSAFRRLKQRVDSASHIDAVIDELSTELDRIATNFEHAARLRRDYADFTVSNNFSLRQKQQQTRQAIHEIDRRIAIIQSELNTAGKAMSHSSLTDTERNRITISANTSVLNSLRAQKDIWQHFEQTQSRLITTLNVSTEKIDFLLFVLEKNAQVYREASNTAKLRRSVRMALNDLQALGAIEASLTDLQSSWQEVDQIVGEIGRQEFGYAGS